MGRFEFRSHEIELDIAGVQATVPASMEYAEKLKKAAHKMTVWGNDPANANASNDEAKEFMLNTLDELLGEDVMDRIETERELNLYDCLDLFKYINEEVSAYHSFKIETYTRKDVPEGAQPMAMVAENRATRRARRKHK